jgi:hypothetical protein
VRGGLRAGVLAALGLLSLPAAGQERPERTRTVGAEGGGAYLHQVRSAAFRSGDLVILTAPGPALHLVEGTRRRSWGARGRGPAELTNPFDVTWAGGRIVVRDSELRKLVSYDRTGNLVATRPLPGGLSIRLEVAGRDTLVELIAGSGRVVVRLAGARQDTVLRYGVPADVVHLSAAGAPSLTVPAPFIPMPHWAPLPDGRIAFWDGAEGSLRLLDRTGRQVGRLSLPPGRQPVTAADREAWFAAAIPGELRGQRVFEPLRRQARSSGCTSPRGGPRAPSASRPGSGCWRWASGRSRPGVRTRTGARRCTSTATPWDARRILLRGGAGTSLRGIARPSPPPVAPALKFIAAQVTTLMQTSASRRNLKGLAGYLLFLAFVVVLYTILFHVLMEGRGRSTPG